VHVLQQILPFGYK